MAIYTNQVTTHGSGGTGDDTVPPGISGLDWCNLVTDGDLLELTTFLTVNILTIGALTTNVRTPLLGSLQTYIGLTAAQRTAAIAAGAVPMRNATVPQLSFDSPHSSSPPYWEP